MDQIDWDLVDDMISKGYITVREHPELPLLIYNYTAATQGDDIWNNATLNCRGLITTNPALTGKRDIVGRPFAKFFNLGQAETPDEPFEVFEKYDGSLFIVCLYEGKLVTATRGSFTSEQSMIGRRKLCDVMVYPPDDLWEGNTYLFELLYAKESGKPQIIVDYGSEVQLILLGIIDNNKGEIPYDKLRKHPSALAQRFKKVEKLDLDHLSPSELDEIDEENREGFVLRFHSGKRIKIKFEWYKARHKLLCGLTPKRIWTVLKDGGNVHDDILLGMDIPDEFHHWLTKTAMDLYEGVHKIRHKALKDFAKIPKDPWIDRKTQALYIKEKCEYHGLMFSLLDGNNIEHSLWKMVKPEKNETYHESHQPKE